MLRNFIAFAITLLMVLPFTGCEDRTELTAPQVTAPNTGTADFSRFVVIGNSLTAGYQAGALYKSSQEYSYGNLLAQQVVTNFEQPYVSDPGLGSPGRIEIKSVSPFATEINLNQGTLLNPNLPAPYNNLGVPGALLWDFLNATNSTDCFSGKYGGLPNPFFDAILRNSALNLGSQFNQAKVLQPTFVIFWLGNNDLLGYATSGGTTPYTDEQVFMALYNEAMDSLATLGANVLVGNVFDVSLLPYFTTVGGQLMQQGTTHVFAELSDSTVGLVSLASNLLTLTAQTELATGKGQSPDLPLSNKVVLDSMEIGQVKYMQVQFNNAIQQSANSHGFTYVDVNSELLKIAQAMQTGQTYSWNDISFDLVYVQGGVFSLDGIHPTNHGQAIFTNVFINAINSNYNASIPLVNVSEVPPSLYLQ